MTGKGATINLSLYIKKRIEEIYNQVKWSQTISKMSMMTRGLLTISIMTKGGCFLLQNLKTSTQVLNKYTNSCFLGLQFSMLLVKLYESKNKLLESFR